MPRRKRSFRLGKSSLSIRVWNFRRRISHGRRTGRKKFPARLASSLSTVMMGNQGSHYAVLATTSLIFVYIVAEGGGSLINTFICGSMLRRKPSGMLSDDKRQLWKPN